MNKTITIKDIIFWGAVILAVSSFLNTCKGGLFGGLFGGKRTDTISVKSDTVWVLTQGDTTYIPVPHKIVNTIYTPLYKTDTLEITEVLPTDTVAIINKFFQKAHYSDTQNISTFGKVIIDDTIYRNRILNRRLRTDLKIPEVTNTVTIEQKKNVVYLGASVIGTPTTPIYGVGGDVSIKSPNDKIYSVGAFSNVKGDVWYQAGFKVPIRLRKKTK